MSKTDSSLRLLAILRFSVPSNSSRTLNATQAYDVTSSGITLATATGTLLDKDAAVKSSTGNPLVTASLSFIGAGANLQGTVGTGKETQILFGGSDFFHAYVAVKPTVLAALAKKKQSANKCTTCDDDGKCCSGFGGAATTFGFAGTASGEVFALGLLNKSKATNPNTFFYGAITVGTGDYKKWQGKYAVLKINTTTGKGVLRIYDA